MIDSREFTLPECVATNDPRTLHRKRSKVTLKNIVVQSVTGTRLRFRMEVAPQTRTIALKTKIEELWHVPPLLQKLVLDDTMLDNSVPLSDYLPPSEDELRISMVVVCDEAFAALKRGDNLAKCAAAEALQKVIQSGDQQVVHALAACLQTQDGPVRLAALRALASMALKGDESALKIAQRHGSDVCPDARLVALRMNVHGALHGDRQAALSVLGFLQDQDIVVRQETIKCLSGLSREYDAMILSAISELLAHERSEVRQAALEALTIIVSQDKEALFDKVILCLSDSDWMVRHAAIEVLPTLAGKRYFQAARAVTRCLADVEVCIRLAAETALQGLIEIPHEEVSNSRSPPANGMEDQNTPHTPILASQAAHVQTSPCKRARTSPRTLAVGRCQRFK